MTTSAIVYRARRTLSDAATRARAFEWRHRTLFDSIAAAIVGLLAIAGWYMAFALFND